MQTGQYIGSDHSILKGHNATLLPYAQESAGGNERRWVQAQFHEPLEFTMPHPDNPQMMIVQRANAGWYMFPADDFFLIAEPSDDDPLIALGRILGQGDPFEACGKASRGAVIDLDRLAHALATHPVVRRAEDMGSSVIDETIVRRALNATDGDATPAQAALAYALWDQSNSVRLETPEQFATMLPEAQRLEAWIRFHRFELIHENERDRLRLWKGIGAALFTIDLVVIALLILLWSMGVVNVG